jgi:hypothetical protein
VQKNILTFTGNILIFGNRILKWKNPGKILEKVYMPINLF